MAPSFGSGRRLRATILAAVALVAVLGALAAMIIRASEDSRAYLQRNFRMRASSSATLVATYIEQQAERERLTAEIQLSGPRVSESRFETVTQAFGSRTSVLVDSRGRLLAVAPRDPRLIGKQVAAGYQHLREAEQGRRAVSGVVFSAVNSESVTAVAVPFSTPFGRRVFSAAYPVRGAELEAFVAHAIAYPQHEVALIDGHERLLAASPRGTQAVTLAQLEPSLAKALHGGSFGTVPGAAVASSFAAAAVPGTNWRIVLEVPDSRLYASIGGLTEVVPWLIFAFVSVLGVLLLVLFARSLRDRARLGLLSAELEGIARTDPLTGLLNRRGIEEDTARAFARARRRGEPITVLMIDLDRFKEVNDRFGHEAGDRVLLALADCMRDVLRLEDVYGRVGGDEFVALLVDADERAGRAAAERLEDRAARVDLADVGLEHGIAMSIGCATGVHTSPADLMRAADAELYRVKGARHAARGPAPAATARGAGRSAT